MSSPEQVGGYDRVVEPLEPAPPRKPPTRRRRRPGVAAAVPRTRRQCANGPAPMDIRSAIEVESPATSWKPSPPAHRRRQLQTQNRQCSGVRRPRGTSTDARERVAALVRDVPALPSAAIEVSGHASSPCPTGRPSRSSADRAMVGAGTRPSARRYSVAICPDRGTRIRQFCAGSLRGYGPMSSIDETSRSSSGRSPAVVLWTLTT
jgi:hypothetical protein